MGSRAKSERGEERVAGRRTSLMAQMCLSSSWLIFPFGNDHELPFHPLTRMHCERGREEVLGSAEAVSRGELGW